jgi:hypothetical protein
MFFEDFCQHQRRIPGIVVAAMMHTFQRQFQQGHGLHHAYIMPQAAQQGVQRFNVQMGRAEGVGDILRGTLALEHLPVIIAITRPDALAGFVLFFQDGARRRERSPLIDLLLGERGEFGAKRADHRAFRLDHQTALIVTLPIGGAQSTHPNFDNFIFLAGGRRAIPARTFDVYNDDLVVFARQLQCLGYNFKL